MALARRHSLRSSCVSAWTWDHHASSPCHGGSEGAWSWLRLWLGKRGHPLWCLNWVFNQLLWEPWGSDWVMCHIHVLQ